MILTVPKLCLPIVAAEGVGDSQQPCLNIHKHLAASRELRLALFPHTADGGRAARGSEHGDVDWGDHRSWFQAVKPESRAEAETHTVGPRMES